MQELAAVCRRQRRGRDAGAILAAPQFIGAGKMIERAPPFALRQPEQAERAMAAVVLRLDGAGAAVALDGVARAAARFERGRAIVMRGGVARLGGDRRVEMTDRVGVLALRGGEDAEVVGDGAVAGRHAQRRAIRSLRLVEPARLVQGDRVRHQLLELACCQCVHGPVTGCCEMSTTSRRRLAAAALAANSMAPERTRERPAIWTYGWPRGSGQALRHDDRRLRSVSRPRLAPLQCRAWPWCG